MVKLSRVFLVLPFSLVSFSNSHAIVPGATIMLILPPVLMAQSTEDSDEWKFGVQLYGWLPQISGSAASGSEVDVDQGDLLDVLQMTL